MDNFIISDDVAMGKSSVGHCIVTCYSGRLELNYYRWNPYGLFESTEHGGVRHLALEIAGAYRSPAGCPTPMFTPVPSHRKKRPTGSDAHVQSVTMIAVLPVTWRRDAGNNILRSRRECSGFISAHGPSPRYSLSCFWDFYNSAAAARSRYYAGTPR